MTCTARAEVDGQGLPVEVLRWVRITTSPSGSLEYFKLNSTDYDITTTGSPESGYQSILTTTEKNDTATMIIYLCRARISTTKNFSKVFVIIKGSHCILLVILNTVRDVLAYFVDHHLHVLIYLIIFVQFYKIYIPQFLIILYDFNVNYFCTQSYLYKYLFIPFSLHQVVKDITHNGRTGQPSLIDLVFLIYHYSGFVTSSHPWGIQITMDYNLKSPGLQQPQTCHPNLNLEVSGTIVKLTSAGPGI